MQQQRANWYERMEHFSITGYQVKSQQKEEGLAFKELSAVLWKVIQKQENVNKYELHTLFCGRMLSMREDRFELTRDLPVFSRGRIFNTEEAKLSRSTWFGLMYSLGNNHD